MDLIPCCPNVEQFVSAQAPAMNIPKPIGSSGLPSWRRGQ